MTQSITVLRTQRAELKLELPQASRVRLITTSSLASSLTGLWIAAPLYLPDIPFVPDTVVDVRHVAIGFLVPFGVGFFSLFFAERRARRDLRPARREDYGTEVRGGER